ncbi:MAG: hypothetical protein LJE69_02075 [Thiohalocapsa sp.]|jgi:hypothetical protein|uniref:hypothetical protein n=1 Tax=Thiohalocapsa sp. TaxID=2497641 RepID=UPI0025EB59BF|nr:hypothetical protein [Thiohalocapsa sp.]MCG6940021.1 hypothetical protein [Thiohalocapsa sp.]
MADPRLEAGVIQAILTRLEQQTLPRALDIKRRVDAGDKLMDSDTLFLDDALAGLRRDGPYVQHHPQWEPLYSRLIDLYDKITRKALENEQRG